LDVADRLLGVLLAVPTCWTPAVALA